MVQLKFVAKSLNELCCNEYGSPIFVETADKVFEDILGVHNLVSKLYMAGNLQKAVSIINNVGFDILIDMFDQSAYRDAISDMIQTKDRIEQLQKESKKLYKKINSSDGKRKHREQDLVAYKQKTKEIRYATEIYESAIKRLRKYLGIKNPKKKSFNKERYTFLKNFAKRSEDGFFNEGFGDDEALGDYAFDGFESLYSLANDAGHHYVNSMRKSSRDTDSDSDGEFAKFVEEENREMVNRSKSPSHNSSKKKFHDIPDFITSADEMRRFEHGYDEDDDDEEEEDNEYENASRSHSRNSQVDTEIDKRFAALNEKYEMLGRTLSKVIPSTRDAFENQREKEESNDEIMEQILRTLNDLSKKVDAVDEKYNKVRSLMTVASKEYRDAKESYDTIREMLLENEDDDSDEVNESDESEDSEVITMAGSKDETHRTDLESVINKSDYVPDHPRHMNESDIDPQSIEDQAEDFKDDDSKQSVQYPKDTLRKLADPVWMQTHQDVEIIRNSKELLNNPIMDTSTQNPDTVLIAPGVDKKL